MNSAATPHNERTPLDRAEPPEIDTSNKPDLSWVFENDTLSTFTLRRRTPGSFVLVPSDREGRCIRCQGQLEAAAARVLVTSPSVNALREQPLQVWYEHTTDHAEFRLITRTPNECRDPPVKHATKLRTYLVPDFLVRMHDGRLVLIEVKAATKLDKPDIMRKLKVAALFAQSNGWQFHILTEHELTVEPLRTNVRLVSRHRRFVVPDEALDRLTASIAPTGRTVRKLSSEVGLITSDIWPMVLHLLSRHRLSCDLVSQPLNAASTIYPKGAIEWDPFASAWAPSGSSMDGPGAWSGNHNRTD
jgi:hypothetical protein